MAGTTPDIRLLFGVLGDGAIDGASGQEIAKRLGEIASALEPIKVKVAVDDGGLADFKSKLDAIKAITFDITNNLSKSGVKISADTGATSVAEKEIESLNDDITKELAALSKIESIRHSLSTARLSVDKFSDNQSIADYSNQIDNITHALDKLRNAVMYDNLTVDQFDMMLKSIGRSADVTKNSLDEFVKSSKNASLSFDTKDFNSALTQIESMRHTLESAKTMTTPELSLFADDDKIKAYDKDITGLLGLLDDLKGRVQTNSISTKEFSDQMSTLSLMTKETKNGLDEYVSVLKQTATSYIKDDDTTFNKSLTSIETLRHTIASMSNITSQFSGDAKIDGFNKDIEALLGLLDEFKTRVQTDSVSTKEFAEEMSSLSLMAKETNNSLDEYVKTSRSASISFDSGISAEKQIESIRHSLENAKIAMSQFKDDSKVDAWTADVERLSGKLADLSAHVKDGDISTRDFKNTLGEIGNEAKSVTNKFNEYVKVLKQTTVSYIGDDQTQINKALESIEVLRHSLAETTNVTSRFTDDSTIKAYEQDVATLLNTLDELKNRIQTDKVTTKEFAEEISRLGLKTKETKNQLDEYVKAKKRDAESNTLILRDTKEYADASSQMSDYMKKIVDAQKMYKDSFISTTRSEDLSALKQYKREIDQLYVSLQNGTLSQEEFASTMRAISSSVDSTLGSLSTYQTFTERLSSQISSLSKTFLTFYTTHRILMTGIRVIKDLIDQSIELESAFADVRIVTHATNDELERYSRTIADAAQETSTPIADLVSAATTFSRLGYSLDESATLAKFTGMLEKVGNVDTQQAEDAITSIMKAFPKEADVGSIESIMDRLVETGNNFPISVQQIAEGMTNASSAMSAAGNSFDQTVALLTAANTTVQNAAKASTALRTISARIRKTKTELDDLGESMTEATYDKLVGALTEHHVALTTIDGEFRSTYDIMKDIASEWQNMTSMEQAAIAEAIAGTRQQTVFYSIVENFKEASGAMDAMSQSAGALSESYDIYLGTTQAHIQQFHTAWQTLARDAVDSDTAKLFVDTGTALLKVADGLQRVHMLIPTIVSGFNTIKAIQFARTITSSQKAVTQFVTSLTAQQTITKSLEQEYLALTAVEQRETLAQLSSAAAAGDAAAQHALEAMSVAGLTTAEEVATVATNGLTVSIKGLLSSNPLGWIMLAVSGLIMLVQNIKDAQAEVETSEETLNRVHDEMSRLASDANNVANSYRDLKSSANDIIPRFTELASGVDEFRGNVSLTDEEYEEFLELNNQIADMLPSIKAGFDDNGDAILNLSYKAEDLSTSLWDAVEAQRELANISIADNMGEAIKLASESSNAYKQQEEDAMESLAYMIKLQDSIKSGSASFDFDESQYKKFIETISKFAPDIENFDKSMHDVFGNYMQGLQSGYINHMNEEEVAKEFDKLESSFDSVIKRIQAELYSVRQQSKSDSNWDFVSQTAMAYVQTQLAYLRSDDTIQKAIDEMVSGIDFSDIGAETSADVTEYLTENVLGPIESIGTEAKGTLSAAINAKNLFDSGSSSVFTMTTAINELNNGLHKAGVEANTIKTIMSMFGFESITAKLDDIRKLLVDDTEEAEEFLLTLTGQDIDLVYKILNENGSMSFEELRVALEEMKKSINEIGEEIDESFVVPDDFSDFFDDLGKATKKIDSVTSAMEKLQKGTNLTTKELIKMAEEYPELLRQANLFTDKSIEGRKRLMNVMLEASRKEYEDQIDKKIAELNIDLETIKKQIDLEKTKQKIRMDIYAKYITGQIDLTASGVREIAELQALGTKDYAKLKEGEVEVNRGALKKENENTFGLLQQAVERIWSPYATDVGQIYIALGRQGIQSTGEYVSATQQMLQALGWSITESIYNSIQDANARSAIEQAAVSAYANMQGISVIDWMNSYNSVFNSNTAIYRNFSGSLIDLTSGYKSVDDWYSQESVSAGKIIDQLEQNAEYIKNQIDNLNGMKDMLDDEIKDISNMQDKADTSINDSSGKDSSTSTKESNPLLDEFNAWYKLQKHLQEMGDPSFDLSRFIAELESRIKKLKEAQAMTAEDAYKYEEEVAKAAKKFEDDAKEALDNVVRYRMKILEEQKKSERDALNDRLDELKKFFDKQKQMLRDQYEEEQYLKEQAEKRKTAADIQAQIDQLRNDDSAWAHKKVEELRVKLREANEDLEDFERERALEDAEKFLDDEYEKQAAEIQAAIEKIDDTLNDPKAIYNIALAEIRSNSSAIYDEMSEYGEKNGDGITNEATELLKELADAIRDYQNYQHELMLIVYGKDVPYGGYDGMSPPKGYASGTRSATPGLHLIDELGAEAIFQSSNGNKYRMFSGGEKVLNAKATEFLYAFAEAGSRLMGTDMVGANITRGLSGQFNAGSIYMGDIIINGNADKATVSEIRRAQRESMNLLLKEFSKLKA